VDDEFGASRVFEVVRTDEALRPGTVVGSRGPAGAIGIDNDRRHRAIDPLANAWDLPSVPSSTRRLKLSYPER
jgi:hypothetical protein